MTKVSVFDIDFSISAERWAAFVEAVRQTDSPTGSVLRNTRGVSWWAGVLTIENLGSPFVIQMLKRPDARDLIKQTARKVFPFPVTDIELIERDAVKE